MAAGIGGRPQACAVSPSGDIETGNAMTTHAEMLEFLLTRKYPDHKEIKHKVQMARRLGVPVSADVERRAKIGAYDASLRELTPDGLEALYNEEYASYEAERAKEIADLKQRADQEEQRYFFNQPYSKADYVHWSKAAHWTLDEAVALSLGRAPEIVKWDTVKEYVRASPFAFQYSRVRDLALRAKQWAQLYDPVLPGNFLAWAKRFDITYPPELEEQVAARGHAIQDWKTLHDQIKAQYDEYTSRAKGALDVANATIRELNDENENLRAERNALAGEIEHLRGKATNPEPEGRPLGTKERGSLLKLIIGMAIVCYRYDPRAARSSVPDAIAGELAQVGISISNDTVRKWLKMGVEFAPQTAFNDGTE
jgi:hypothetical protein